MIYDLLIIGAGMSGISVGHFFRDQQILILERGDVAGEATGKNAGFLISGFGEHFHSTTARSGIQAASDIQRIHLSNHRRIRDLAIHLDCDYRQTGSLALAMDSTEAGELLESCRLMQQAGFPVEWIKDPAVGLRATKGALLNPEDGRMEPRKFWTQLAAGLPVKSNCEVRGYSHNGLDWTVETSQGTYRGSRLVFCLNAFASNIVPILRGRYIPLRGQMLEWPLAGATPTDRPIYTQHGDIYWRFREGRLILGGLEDRVPEEEVGIAHTPSVRITEEQMNWIRTYFDPALLAEQPTSSWCSSMAFTVDGFPFVGELPQKNSYVLSGLCGLGHGYAMECASWLYELIAQERNIIPPQFASDRIESLPVYTEGPWRKLYEAWNH